MVKPTNISKFLESTAEKNQDRFKCLSRTVQDTTARYRMSYKNHSYTFEDTLKYRSIF